jgi:predicted YcjX-like family ATPase
MQNAQQVVNEEAARGSFAGQAVPEDLKPAFDRHRENLVRLAMSLETAGKDTPIIRSLVANLLKMYEDDLLALIEARL